MIAVAGLNLEVEFVPASPGRDATLSICDDTLALASIHHDDIDLRERRLDFGPKAHALAHLFAAAPKLLLFVESIAFAQNPIADPDNLRRQAARLTALARGES